jgi:acyl phosphate:glycerol-3-phosphate acyltransferase
MLSFIAVVISLIPLYLLGSFPTGLIVARIHGIDITAKGSGNVGATNVSRVIGKRAGVLTLVGDALKGIIALLLASVISNAEWFVALAGFIVVCGHCFSIPPWLKGGKGVATGLGVLSFLYPLGALLAVVTFGVVFVLTRIVSLSSIVSALIVPLAVFATNQGESLGWALAGISFVIVIRHHQNIVRLIEGREPRFASKGDAKTT